MKKIIAVAIAAVMMIAMATTAFGLVIDTPAAYKNPPVFVSGLAISDAWMSGLTAQNWTGSLTNQAYAEGSYIWFIARIGVAANGDTDAQHLWDGNGNDTAELTITGKDNCLNLTSANMATLAMISGMSVTARQIENNNLGLVEATENKAKFTFSAQLPSHMDGNRVLQYANTDLRLLHLDAIYGANAWLGDANGNITWGSGNSRATLQKDYYLHFMGITKAATEGVAVATMKVNGEDEFARDQAYGANTYGVASDSSYQTRVIWGSGTTSINGTKLMPGDRSVPYLLYNTVNGKTYGIFKISGEGVAADAGFGNGGSYYIITNPDLDEFVIGFAVKGGTFMGLLTYEKDFKVNGTAVGSFDYWNNANCYDAASYIPLMSNDGSSNLVSLSSAYRSVTVSTAELQAIFDFFGFAYANPKAPTDADFLARSGLVTVAEAKYNVANAVITTPDTNIVIPKTGDAATSTGLILVATAILAAAAVGFVLSKRSYN